MSTRTGFTLVELMIVVAILVILATIAIPHYAEFRDRAHVSRAQVEMRTVAVALESYRADLSGYPLDQDDRGDTLVAEWHLPIQLTTPVAYLSDVDGMVRDSLSQETPADEGSVETQRARRYRYVNYELGLSRSGQSHLAAHHPASAALPLAQLYEAGAENYGRWRLSAAGPNGKTDQAFLTDLLLYDPTNGTRSDGDLVRAAIGVL